jgi:hypothetical protein
MNITIKSYCIGHIMSRVGEYSVVYLYLLSFLKTLRLLQKGSNTKGARYLEILFVDALENREE